MADNLTVSLRLTADGKQLVAEVKGAQATVQQIGPVTQQAGAQATTALKQVEVQAQAVTMALRNVPVVADQLKTITVGAQSAATSITGIEASSARFQTVATRAAVVGSALANVGLQIAQGGSAFDAFAQIRAFDASGTGVAATVDARITGY